jgi:branched-chain amino acid transport system ATP-binding protein
MSQNKHPVLEINNLSIAFGGLKAVDNFTLAIEPGEIFGLIGPNGAGKTTIFNCITQFYKPDSGSVKFFDKNNETIELTKLNSHDVIKHGLVRTFQNLELIREISVLDNVLIGGHIQYKSTLIENILRLPRANKEEKILTKKAIDALKVVGVEQYANAIVAGLPYGILKKVELARTLMADPKFIIFDEPAAGLNDSETDHLVEVFKGIREKYNVTILLVEHDMELVMKVCDRICAISFGKLIAVGTPSQIKSDPKVKQAYLGEDF